MFGPWADTRAMAIRIGVRPLAPATRRGDAIASRFFRSLPAWERANIRRMSPTGGAADAVPVSRPRVTTP